MNNHTNPPLEAAETEPDPQIDARAALLHLIRELLPEQLPIMQQLKMMASFRTLIDGVVEQETARLRAREERVVKVAAKMQRQVCRATIRDFFPSYTSLKFPAPTFEEVLAQVQREGEKALSNET